MTESRYEFKSQLVMESVLRSGSEVKIRLPSQDRTNHSRMSSTRKELELTMCLSPLYGTLRMQTAIEMRAWFY